MIRTLILPDAQGMHDVLIEAGNKDGRRLAQEIDAAFSEALQTHMRDARFSGRFQVVILAETPVTERQHVVPVVERARSVCAELSARGQPYQLILSYAGKEGLRASTIDLGGVTPSPSSVNLGGHVLRRSHLVWAAVCLAAAVLAVGIWSLFRSPLPGSLDVGARMRRATHWTRDGVTDGVYLFPGDRLEDASARLTALVSSTQPISALDAVARTEHQHAGLRSYYDIDDIKQACAIDAPSSEALSPISIHLRNCRVSEGRAVCVEFADRLRQEIVAMCQEEPTAETRAMCFSDVCVKQHQVRSKLLGTAMSALLSN